MISRYKGFCAFQKKLDGKSAEDYSKVSILDLYYLRRVFERGLVCSLSSAFSWATTRQGSDYWRSICVGRSLLIPEDIEYLKGLYEYSKGNYQK